MYRRLIAGLAIAVAATLLMAGVLALAAWLIGWLP